MVTNLDGREADAKYSVGDIIRVKEYKDIECLAVSRVNCGIGLPSNCHFMEPMKQYCGKEYKIERVSTPRDVDGQIVGFYYLKDCMGWCFTDEMIEDVNPIILYDALKMSFDDLMEVN